MGGNSVRWIKMATKNHKTIHDFMLYPPVGELLSAVDSAINERSAPAKIDSETSLQGKIDLSRYGRKITFDVKKIL